MEARAQPLSAVRQQIRFCRSRDGTRLAYAVCGKGPALFFVPHWVHHLDMDFENGLWKHWLKWLSARYTLYRHDWRGCGLSDREGVQFSADRYVEDLEAVAAAAKLGCPPVIGISNGAIFGAMYAARNPERVSQLVLLECQARGRLGSDPSPEEVEALNAWLKVIELGWTNEHLSYGQFFTSLHLSEATLQDRKDFHDLCQTTTSCANALAMINTFARADLRAILPQVSCPTLICHSREDSLIPFEQGRTAASLVPGAEFLPLESRNHLLLEHEAAWPILLNAIERFLRPRTAASESVLEVLTVREREILCLVGSGRTNSEIAKQLKIREKTVRNHVSAIFSKLSLSNRAQALIWARDAGIAER